MFLWVRIAHLKKRWKSTLKFWPIWINAIIIYILQSIPNSPMHELILDFGFLEFFFMWLNSNSNTNPESISISKSIQNQFQSLNPFRPNITFSSLWLGPSACATDKTRWITRTMLRDLKEHRRNKYLCFKRLRCTNGLHHESIIQTVKIHEEDNNGYDRWFITHEKNHKEQLCIRPLDCQLLIAHVTCQLQENKRIDS